MRVPFQSDADGRVDEQPLAVRSKMVVAHYHDPPISWARGTP